MRQNSTKGMYFVAGYTWAHAIDTSGSNRQFNIQNSYDPAFERSNSDSDIRNRFTFAMTYELPSKHGFAQMLRAGTSMDFHRSGRHAAFLLRQLQRHQRHGRIQRPLEHHRRPGQPSLVEEHSHPVSRRGPVHHGRIRPGQRIVPRHRRSQSHRSALLRPGLSHGWTGRRRPVDQRARRQHFRRVLRFRKDHLTPPAPGTFGNMRRNVVYGPGFVNLDFSVIKDFKFGERLQPAIKRRVLQCFQSPELRRSRS